MKKFSVYRLFSFLILTMVFGLYQNCSDVSFTPEAESGVGNSSGVGSDPKNNDPPPSDEVFNQKTKLIDVKANGDVDILFVVDNSGSMKEEQKELANRISGFMNLIEGLNWQISLTTTDTRPNVEMGDGKFKTFGNGSPILKAGDQSPEEAQSLLASAIDVGINGSGNESGIYTTFRAVEHKAEGAPYSDFFRANASLAVILISDEDECSRGNCLSTQARSVPQNLITQIKASLGNEKSFNFHSIIKIPGDPTCTSAYYEGAVYEELSILSGGIVASICAENYSSLLGDIGEKVVELVASTTLSCSPADIDDDNIPDIYVTLQGGDILKVSDFKLQGDNVSFDDPLPEGEHSVTYYCKK